jgi:hypothetical protein
MADSVDFLDNAFKAMQIAVALEQNGKLTEALECCDQSLAILVVAIQGMLKHACVYSRSVVDSVRCDDGFGFGFGTR